MTIFALLSAGGVDQNAANPDLGVGEIFTIRMDNITNVTARTLTCKCEEPKNDHDQ